MPLQKTTVQIPFGAGLSQRSDDRASQPPALDIASDIQFDELGGVQTRYPFASLGSNIFGGGTISNARKLVANGDELLLFTSDTLYSWNAVLSAWVAKGTHLAVKVDERTMFASTGDQIDGDRAELSNTIVFAWTEGTVSYLAAIDKTTGSALLSPTSMGANTYRPRLVALSTKILLLVHDNANNLFGWALDPLDPGGSFNGTVATTILGTNANLYYDACRIASTDAAIVGVRRVTTTSYSIIKVTAAMAVTASTKARTCDGPIAVSVDPTGTSVQVIRANGTNIQGDLITISSLADAFTAQAVGTGTGTINQIAAAHRSVQNSAQYRCYAFWSSNQNTANSSAFAVKSNWVDTGNTLGTQGTFLAWCGVASRAVDYNGQVYVWCTFGQTSGLGSGAASTSSSGQFQNAYFLLRDDTFIAAKSVYNRGGGLLPTTGHLPGVASLGSGVFAWCAQIRRVIALGGGSGSGAVTANAGYAMRAPQDVVFTFDSNYARRTARLGSTMYIAAGEGLQYDGSRIAEVGFHVSPWYFDAIVVGPGSMADGVYGYKSTFRWLNARGEIERSSTATVANSTMMGGPSGMTIETISLPITHKTASAPAVEIWRTALNPTAEAPFFLVSGLDPTVTTGANAYLASSNTLVAFNPTFNDREADAAATLNQAYPGDGGILEDLAPPAATLIIASEDRLFLAGIAGDRDRVWYSKQRNDGEVAAFNDALTFAVPPQGGDITALAILNGTLIVFRQHAVYAFPGSGFDNAGLGQNYGPAQILSQDVGAVSHEAVAITPEGVIFKSASKGWHVVDRGWSLKYIGASVVDFDTDTVYAVHVMESKQQIRCLTNHRIMVFDYVALQWGQWTISDGLHAAIWNGTYAYLTSTGPKTEQAAYTSLTYGIDVESAWIKFDDLQGFARVLRCMILGEYRSACAIRVRIARDYESDGSGGWSYFDDVTWNVTPQVVGGPLQLRHGPSRQQCEAIKVRITALAAGSTAAMSTHTDLSDNVVVIGFLLFWESFFRSSVSGAGGNAVTFSAGFASSGTSAWSIEVRDGQLWNGTTQVWSTLANNVGVKVLCRAGSSPTVADLEAAIDARSQLIAVSTPDPDSAHVIDATAMAGITTTAVFSGGTDVSTSSPPSGEALKLTGLAFEVGIKPGLNKRVPAAQKA